MHPKSLACRITLAVISTLCVAQSAKALEFEVTLSDEIVDRSISGRMFVFLSANKSPEPRFGPNWFSPEPFFGLDVDRMKPGEARTVDSGADGFPSSIDRLPSGNYYAQAVFDLQLDSARRGRAPGNFYSSIVRIVQNERGSGKIAMELDSVVPEESFPHVGWLREIVRRNEMLSRFHGRNVVDRAGVVLPASYLTDPTRRYPVIYSVPGFGGSHREALRYAEAAPRATPGDVEFIRVSLSGDCEWGHHCFADSATNGPRGRALVEELIPYIDTTFRTIARPQAKFLTGHSSGGWSSLCLQVAYPDDFGGVWSTAPDPVDFHDFQQIDLYHQPPSNMFKDEQGQRRPIARRGLEPVLWYDSFSRMDDVIKRGGQLRSFEAVFSPRGPDREPLKLWNRLSGAIDPTVARAWDKYDINRVLERDWPTLGPKLEGKLHVMVGGRDTFYLEGAVEKLASTLKRLGSDARITIVPDKDHASLMTAEVYTQIRREMSAAFRSGEEATTAVPTTP